VRRYIYVSTDKEMLAELIPAFDPSALHFPFTLSTTKSLEYMGLVDL
jgi:hypothetical protein